MGTLFERLFSGSGDAGPTSRIPAGAIRGSSNSYLKVNPEEFNSGAAHALAMQDPLIRQAMKGGGAYNAGGGGGGWTEDDDLKYPSGYQPYENFLNKM